MEKLRCSSCGAVLEVDDDKEFAKCKYCGSKYKLNQDMNINIKLDDNTKEVIQGTVGKMKQVQKIVLIPMIIIVSIVFITIAAIGIGITGKSNNKRDVSAFNSTFSSAAGTKNAF